MWNADKTCLGYAGSVQEKSLGSHKYIYIETKKPSYVTILLKGPDRQTRTQIKVIQEKKGLYIFNFIPPPWGGGSWNNIVFFLILGRKYGVKIKGRRRKREV